MRLRTSGIVALLVVVSVITSALATCLPGAMASMPAMAHEHMTCGQESDGGGYRVSAQPADCCKSIEPVVLTKTGSKAPVLDVLHGMNAIVVAPTLPLLVSLGATVSPSPPGSGIAADTPRYVVLRTFLI